MNCLAVGLVPLLLLSYLLLYTFYTSCHPWLSEGVSLGFEPRAGGRWRHQQEAPEGSSRVIPTYTRVQALSQTGGADTGTTILKKKVKSKNNQQEEKKYWKCNKYDCIFNRYLYML